VKISIILPAFNEEKLIVQSLRCVKEAASAFARLGWETELIVCDNNSTDATGELARSEGARVVFEPVNQIGRARNKGAEIAAGNWLVFIDADSQPDQKLFADVAQAIQSGRCLAGGSTVRLDSDHAGARFAAWLWNWISRLGRYLAGSFIFCEAAAFRKLNGFNLELYASEEIELSRRLKKLARQQHKRIVILHRHPLLTSARKVRLYTMREHLSFFGKTILRLGGTLKDRTSCHTWYDGRR